MRDGLTDLIRIGKVSSINAEKATATITFEDRDDIVSGDLQIVVPCTQDNKFYYMPDIGERVRVIFDPEAPSKGCILGSYYADNRLPPVGNPDKVYINFKDETLIEYDRKLHTLTIEIKEKGNTSISIVTSSDINIKSAGKINVEAVEQIEIKSDSDILIETNSNMSLKASGTIDIVSDGAMNIKGSTININ